MNATLTEELPVEVKKPNEHNLEQLVADGGPLDLSKEIDRADKPKDKPSSLLKAEKKQQAKKDLESEMLKAWEEARNVVNPLVDSISLAGKNTLDNVIKVGEVLNGLKDKWKKANFKELLPKVGFNLSEQTARNYQGIATYKNEILLRAQEFEEEAKKTGTVWTFSITDALETVAKIKRVAAQAKARASGKPPRLPKMKKTPDDVIKLKKTEGQAVLILSGNLEDIEVLRNVANEEIQKLVSKFIEDSSFIE